MIAVLLMVVVIGNLLGRFRSCAATAANYANDCQEDASENTENDGRDNRSDIALFLSAADAIYSASELASTCRNPFTIIPGHAAVSDLITCVTVIRAVIVIVIVGKHTLSHIQ